MKTNLVGLGLAACSVTGCFSPDSAAENGETGSAASTGSDATGSPTSAPSSTEPATSVQPTDGSDTSTESSSGEVPTTTGADCVDAVDCDGMLCIDGSCAPCWDARVPDAACAESFADLPYCDAESGTCVPCTNEIGCSDSTPICDQEVGCVACTEHAQCPESACHLGGPDEGRCFDLADVVDVESPPELAGAGADIGPGEHRVLVLHGGTYDSADFPELAAGREIAVLGTADTILDGPLFIGAAAYIYFSFVQISSDEAIWVSQNEDSELWIDDSVLISSAILDGEAHVRRSSIRTDEGSPFGFFSVRTGNDASVYIENTSIGPSPYEGLVVQGPVDVRYSTIAGVSTAVSCNASSPPSGTIRNSIILGSASPAIGEACDGLTWIDNAVNEAGFGTQVGDYDSSWFSPSITSPFLLSSEGESIFADIATWELGDPEFDVEGDARPQDGPGFPGVDEP